MNLFKKVSTFLITSFFFLFLVKSALAVGEWNLTGSMTTPHAFAPLVTLQNGKILEISGTPTSVTELYDESTGAWTETGSLNQGRDQISAVVLNDGKVLIAGGRTGQVFNTTEIYDPSTGVWTYSGNLNVARTAAILVKLADGRVLANAGYDSSFTGMTSSEIYDPSTGVWTQVSNSLMPHVDYASGTTSNGILLNNGKVLIVSTAGGDSFYGEIYDPTTDSWSLTGSMVLARSSGHLLKLSDGRILMAGGASDTGIYYADSEIYNPSTNQWAQTGALNYGRYGNDSVLLPDGRVLTAGGYGIDPSDNTLKARLSAEIYNPSTGVWTVDAALNVGHNGGNMALFPDGKILMAGGYNDSGATTVSELYNPAGRQLTSLSPAKVWVGQSTNGSGIKYDLKAEVYKNATLITSGILNSADAGGKNFSGANLDTISFNSFSPISFPSGSQLSIKLYVRNACTGSKNNGKNAILWWNDSSANSRFDATISSLNNNYYLVSTSGLSATVGSGPMKSVSVDAGSECSAYKLFGTWTGTP